MSSARDAIECHIQGLKDDGQQIPQEEGLVIGRVDVRAA
jgi:predicted RNase H-like HicB family nuclease